MKLLLDQNLSHRLVARLEDLYPESSHVAFHQLDTSPDEDVWSFARDNGFTIVSKDSDLSEISLVHGFPPSVIWIRRGNCSTSEIESMLRSAVDELSKFAKTDGGIFILF